MTESLRKFFERLLLCLACFVLPALFFVFFQMYYRTVFAERVTRDFVKEVSAKGCLDIITYENYLVRLAKAGGYTAKVSYTTYGKEPYYGYYASDVIDEYYDKRNVRQKYPLESEPFNVEVCSLDKLFLKKESNASVLALLMSETDVSFPSGGNMDETSFSVIVPEQELYVGEMFTTVLSAVRNGVGYYCIADELVATVPGQYEVSLKIGGVDTGQKIKAVVWEKTVSCENGHVYPRTESVIAHYKSTGKWECCPFCEKNVVSIVMEPSACAVPLGTSVNDVPVSLKVTHMDGHIDDLTLSEVVNDYSMEYAGEQTVFVSYGGEAYNVGTITTESPACVDCGGGLGVRSSTDCKAEGRCSLCISTTPIFLGEYGNFSNTYVDDAIKETLQNGGVFDMRRGDYLSVEVLKVQKKKSGLQNLPVYFRMGEIIRGTPQGE